MMCYYYTFREFLTFFLGPLHMLTEPCILLTIEFILTYVFYKQINENDSHDLMTKK